MIDNETTATLMNADLSNVSVATLEELKLRIENETFRRREEDFNKRIEIICKLLEELRNDYPWVDYSINIQEGNGDYNLFDVVNQFVPEEFTF